MSAGIKHPPMKAEVLRFVEGEVEIHVEHAPSQSYSRAVDPRAMMEARKALRDGHVWELFDVDYSVEQHKYVSGLDTEHRSRSVFYFRRKG